MSVPKKVVVIGCDAALPKRILKFMEEGALPTFKRLIEGGVIANNCLVPLPTITPPNWTTIATGAWPGTHGITDYWVHTPGNELTMESTKEGFDRRLCQVQNIWEAAESVGLKSIVYNFPSSWHTELKDGILVAGNSNIIDDWRSHDNYGFTVCTDAIFSHVLYPRGGVKVEAEEAEGWANAPAEDHDEHMEVKLPLPFIQAIEEMEPTTWYCLVQDSQGDGYDTVSLCASRDHATALCTVKKGEWSKKITTTLKTKTGEEREVTFRAKLMELSDDAGEFKLYLTGLSATSGFSVPPEISKEISDYVDDETDVGIRGGGLRAFRAGWIDVDTYVEVNEFENRYLAQSVEYLLKNKEWDIFFMHEHATDWMYHGFFKHIEPEVTKDEAVLAKYTEAEKRIYQQVDAMIGQILEAAGEDVLTVLISDHGATADGVDVTPHRVLAEAGLTAMTLPEGLDKENMSKMALAKSMVVDWSKTRAIPQRACHIYVNLKGRDPQGIVEPEDYDTVRQEIIDTLMTYVDPKTGKRPFALALRREDARPWGNYGEMCGDVVYAVYPWVGGQHGNILPTAEWGVGSIKGLFIMHGPGIKQGVELERTVWITDMVPTICHLMDMPLPEAAEGAILYQAFTDPDIKLKEAEALKAELAAMESKLA